MKVLICVSGNAPDFRFEHNQIFVYEQIESICELDNSIEYRVFPIQGKGVKGYLSSLKKLLEVIQDFKPDLLHAHCGQVGAVAVLQRKVPVITTFHGSDVNKLKTRFLSSFASILSAYSIFVSKKLKRSLWIRGRKSSVIPCGVNQRVFFPMDQTECKQKLGITLTRRYILFSSSFDNKIKNPEMAKRIISHFPNIELMEIRDRSREEVAWLINGSELLLLTSHSEGSPQIIKEAIACGHRVVTVDVGDVREQLSGLPNCAICEMDESKLVLAIKDLLTKPFSKYTPSNRFNSTEIAKTILNIYKLIMQYGKL